MGLDVGHKRIGIAFSDLLGLTAFGYEVLQRRTIADDVAHIRELVEAKDVSEIVVGNPVRTDGTEGPEVRAVAEFVAELKRALPDCTFHLWDERFTTKEAERTLMAQGVPGHKRRQVIDMAAAALILESFMTRRSKE